MPLDEDEYKRQIRLAAATLIALADRLKAGGSEDAFVLGIRSNGEELLAVVGEGDDAFFKTALHDVNRYLPGRKLS